MQEENMEHIEDGRNMSYTSMYSAANRNNPYYQFHKQIHRDLIKEIEASQVDFDGKVTQDNLNPEIWKSGKMLPEIRKKLIKIAKYFYDSLKIDAKIKDLIVTGSMANYNWTPNSDIDLHLIIDYNEINKDKEFVAEYLDDKKKLWSENHNIKIHNFDVELYAQDIEEHSKKDAGVYSLVKNEWITEPKKKDVKIDIDAVKKKAADIINMIEDLPNEEDAEKLVDKAKKIKDRIKKLRQSGLDKGGEYSVENLAFKVLRNKGYLEKLSDISTSALDKDLSINEKFVSKAQQRYFYAQANKGGKEGKKWKDMADEFSSSTNFKKLPEKVKEDSLPGGKGDNRPDSDFDPIELEMGIKVEKEHTGDLDVAIEIAKDHLTEDPHYYSKLKDAGLADELDDELQGEEFREVNRPKNILSVQKGIKDMNDEKIQVIMDFIKFCCIKMHLKNKVKVVLRKGRDEYIRTTASYLPGDDENHIRCEGRSLVDICRSIAHELTHNRQREMGAFKPGEVVQNIGGHLESQADTMAGILIKDFTHHQGYDKIYDM